MYFVGLIFESCKVPNWSNVCPIKVIGSCALQSLNVWIWSSSSRTASSPQRKQPIPIKLLSNNISFVKTGGLVLSMFCVSLLVIFLIFSNPLMIVCRSIKTSGLFKRVSYQKIRARKKNRHQMYFKSSRRPYLADTSLSSIQSKNITLCASLCLSWEPKRRRMVVWDLIIWAGKDLKWIWTL